MATNSLEGADKKGERGSRMAWYVRECFYCLELNDGDARVTVRMRGKVNKADTMMGVCSGGRDR